MSGHSLPPIDSIIQEDHKIVSENQTRGVQLFLSQCPLCNKTMHTHEFEAHYTAELEQLQSNSTMPVVESSFNSEILPVAEMQSGKTGVPCCDQNVTNQHDLGTGFSSNNNYVRECEANEYQTSDDNMQETFGHVKPHIEIPDTRPDASRDTSSSTDIAPTKSPECIEEPKDESVRSLRRRQTRSRRSQSPSPPTHRLRKRPLPSDTPQPPTSTSTTSSLSSSRGKKKKHVPPLDSETLTCPVCNIILIPGSSANDHVSTCLDGGGGPTSSSNVYYAEHNEACEEDEADTYEWAGQTRIRATSYFRANDLSSFSSLPKSGGIENLEAEADVDVDVDGLDCRYGKPQYSEQDIQKAVDEEMKRRKDGQGNQEEVSNNEGDEEVWSGIKIPSNATSDATTLIEVLKKKIQTLQRDQANMARCLICMEIHKIPLVSTVCWHTHCEKCWLLTLATKKLCPQCNMITSASDLRRIFL